MSKKRLEKQEIHERLTKLQGWKLESESLVWQHEFKNFNEAFSFMTKIALQAEKLDHHPDWENVYNRLSIRLSTHDAGGITVKDFELAEFIQACIQIDR